MNPPLPSSSHLVDSKSIRNQIAQALAEDLGTGDRSSGELTTHCKGTIKTRQKMILAGSDWFNETFGQLSDEITVKWLAQDGDEVLANELLCHIEGPANALLQGERTALNFVQLLSAVATETHAYASAVAHTNARILDTRKTLPNLRRAQKYAVHCGGGHNHRMGLYDAVMIKENHIIAAGSLEKALEKADRSISVEVEVENLQELESALRLSFKTRIDRIMIDNFSLDDMRAAVLLREALQNRERPIELEASGNVDLTTVRGIAETGVDYISVGALTKNVNAVDLSFRLIEENRNI